MLRAEAGSLIVILGAVEIGGTASLKAATAEPLAVFAAKALTGSFRFREVLAAMRPSEPSGRLEFRVVLCFGGSTFLRLLSKDVLGDFTVFA